MKWSKKPMRMAGLAFGEDGKLHKVSGDFYSLNIGWWEGNTKIQRAFILLFLIAIPEAIYCGINVGHVYLLEQEPLLGARLVAGLFIATCIAVIVLSRLVGAKRT